MNKYLGKIVNGSKIAIIGGGPAGSFFALYLLHYTEESGIRPDITIYQERDFDELGPKGCKGCAGILSMSLLKNLDELRLAVPEEIIQRKIDHYSVHSPYTSISISNPERERQIFSIYRGGGPRISDYKNSISFDGWLLREVQKLGVKVENQRVTGVYLGDTAQIEVASKKMDFELVVLATGVNAPMTPVTGLNYIPPPTRTMAQQELHAGTTQVEARLGKAAHAFLIPHSEIIFGTLVPKGPFINVSVLGSGKKPVTAASFLKYDIVREVLPQQYSLACSCQPKAVVGPAYNYYGDRFVAIGDCAVSRLYKDGIGSSLLTARAAAHTAINYGIARQDFEKHYRPLCQSINYNNRWGRLLFSINNLNKNSRVFLFTQQRLISNEQYNARGAQRFTKAAWGMFSGNYSYTSIARQVFHPVSLIRLIAISLWERTTTLVQGGATRSRKLYVGGRKVLILGSGFGGSYVLRRLVPSLNRNENVETTMVSDTNYFLFSPLLHEVAAGRIEVTHISYPIRRLHWRDRFNFIHASVKSIDLDSHLVSTASGILYYDYLVLALGSVTDTSELKSNGGNGFFLKSLYDAMLLKNHIIGIFEKAATAESQEHQRQLLTFIIAGAGYTGVQLATELRDFIHNHLLRIYQTIDPANIKIVLVEAEPKIIASLHIKLGAYAMHQLKQMDIDVKLKSRVTHVWDDRVEINDSEVILTNTLIWMTGIVANPRIAELKVKKDDIGRVMVNEYLEIPGVPNVYAIGDCAHFADPVSGFPIEPLAHNAVRQAKVVAYNILADLHGREKKIYHYSEAPQMVSLGANKAVLRFHKIRLYGRLASIIWLAAYTFLVTGQYNRIRILLDRFLSLVFGRDTTLINLKK